jgi:hypothetical protein
MSKLDDIIQEQRKTNELLEKLLGKRQTFKVLPPVQCNPSIPEQVKAVIARGGDPVAYLRQINKSTRRKRA